ncbi:MAG: hypothetical protein ACK58T_12790, partial [Phycisphaerae bacterium]
DGGGAVAERLMTDVLYYVGRGSSEVPRVAEVKRLYELETLIAPDFERPTLTAIDADALHQLKSGVAHAKQHWEEIVGGAADLLFPDLSRRPAFHQIEVKPLTADELRVRRLRFEEGLLGFLRNGD